MNIKKIQEKLAVEGFQYPQSFIKLIELNLIDFDLWGIMDEGQIMQRIEGLKQRYPNRKLIPFARRYDNDDIACFEIGKGECVQIIHDYASEGYEQRKKLVDLWQWLEMAVHEMIEYNKEN